MYRRRYFDGQVTTPAIVTGAVTEEKLADDSVTSRKIKDETISSVDIGAGQVKNEDIADGVVTPAKLSFTPATRPLIPPIVTEEIRDGNVTPPKLSFTPATRPLDPPVTMAELGDGSVTTEKITPQSVNREKLNDDVISAFGHKFNFVSPWRILGPATYENAVPWEELPLATHLPEGTFAVIIQLEISNPPYETGGRPSPEMLSAVHIAMNPAPELRGWVNIRKDESQESGLSVGYQSGTSGTVNFAQGIVPVTDARTIEWELQGDFIPPPTKRVTVAIKLIGFIT